jgi:hypothetical protein
VGRLGLAVEPVGDTAKTCDRRQGYSKQKRVEGKGVGPEVVG